jgi:hypothetical protein
MLLFGITGQHSIFPFGVGDELTKIRSSDSGVPS